jgi:cobyrinic acid a,c-diamide synthase
MTEMLEIPRILIAGDRSSAGKTTISIGIMSVLRDMGYTTILKLRAGIQGILMVI